MKSWYRVGRYTLLYFELEANEMSYKARRRSRCSVAVSWYQSFIE